jgi:hypothetical protein
MQTLTFSSRQASLKSFAAVHFASSKDSSPEVLLLKAGNIVMSVRAMATMPRSVPKALLTSVRLRNFPVSRRREYGLEGGVVD